MPEIDILQTEKETQLSLLHQIQESIVQEGAELSSVLLKLQLLAARLGSDTLEEWVKHESKGYPKDAEIPPYRVVEVSYKGTFAGPFGSGVNNAPIPSALVQNIAGEHWTNHEARGSIAAIEELIRASDKNDNFQIDASNLILLLQGKVYQGYSCVEVKGNVSRTAMCEIRQAVRARILELTLELEKSIPAAAHVTFGEAKPQYNATEKVQQISQQIIYGDVKTAVAGGHGSSISVTVEAGNKESLIKYLTTNGVPNEDSAELATIIESEQPESSEEPFGQRAKHWIAGKMKTVAGGGWNIGLSVATAVLAEAAKQYYGLK